MKIKSKQILWLGVIAVLAILKYFHLFQGLVGHWLFLLPLSIGLTWILSNLEQKAQESSKKKELHYENLDKLRYFFSVIIIILHFRPFVGTLDRLDIAINYMLGRICVPMFFFISSYFIAKKEKDSKNYISNYLRSLIPVYLVWSAFYIPFLLQYLAPHGAEIVSYFSSFPIYIGIPLLIGMIPVGILILLLYSGVYYHLWYFPAFFLSLWILEKWKKKFPVSILLFLSFGLLLLGATETYYGLLPNGFQSWIHSYFDIFITTRNFLFFGLFYVTFGYSVGRKEIHYQPYSSLMVFLCGFLLIFEGLFILTITRKNSNILLSPVLLIYFLFNLLIHVKPHATRTRKYQLRTLYKYYYLTHPMLILLVQYLTIKMTILKGHAVIQTLLLLGMTHLLSIGIIELKKKFPKWVI